MCESSSSIREWMEQPIVISQEACKFALVTAVAMAIFAFGAYCYSYGVASPLYNHTYAYVVWGIATGLVVSFLTVYVARAIVSRNLIRERSATYNRMRQELTRLWDLNYDCFFPNILPQNLPVYENLIGPTGYFDQHDNLDFEYGPIIRGICDNKPFLAVRLRLSNSSIPAILLIGPQHRGFWFVSCSSRRIFCHNNLMERQSEADTFRSWLRAIMNGQSRRSLIRPRFNAPYLIEGDQGPTITLWHD